MKHCFAQNKLKSKEFDAYLKTKFYEQKLLKIEKVKDFKDDFLCATYFVKLGRSIDNSVGDKTVAIP